MEGWEDVVEVVLAPRAAGCAARVQGHLYPRWLCPDLGGGGGELGLPTGWTDFLCRVMPRTGFRDKRVGPQAETITGLVATLYVLLPFPTSGKKKTFSAFHKLNLICKDLVENCLHFMMRHLYKQRYLQL